MTFAEAMASGQVEEPPLPGVSGTLAEATTRFLEVERAPERPGAPMPEPRASAWRQLLSAVDALLAEPPRRASALELARTRLLVETNFDTDIGTFGDVPLDVAERIPATLRKLSARLAGLEGHPRRADPSHFLWPTTPVVVTSAWGDRIHPLHGGVRFHAGVDLSGERAQVVRAAGDGMVVFAGWNGGHGKQIELAHDAHLSTRYSHLMWLLVEVGHRVKQGDIIGLLGDTGWVTGPHLHFELCEDGASVDPEERLPSPFRLRPPLPSFTRAR
jgi:murein DD-endopeptidase MepM/ murein hydrolase activator NlpD